MNLKITVINDLLTTACYLALFIGIIVLSGKVRNKLSPYHLEKELVVNDNPAVAIALCGYYAGVTTVFLGSLWGGSSGNLWLDLLQVGLYGALGILFINLSRTFNDRLILHRLSISGHLVEKRSIGVGAALGATYLATGLIAGGAIYGEGGGIVSALVFFALGQISLAVFSHIYNFFLPFNIHDELNADNPAAGIAFGGAMAALGIVIMASASGDLTDWKNDLTAFGLSNLTAFIFLPLLRRMMDQLPISGRSLSKEIKEDRNCGAALIQATGLVCFSAVLALLLGA